jgi:hypothetical protein
MATCIWKMQIILEYHASKMIHGWYVFLQLFCKCSKGWNLYLLMHVHICEL